MLRGKSITVLFIVALLIAGAGLAAGFLRPKYAVPILMYHTVDPRASIQDGLTVTKRTFERQMEFLRQHRYNVIPLEELGGLIRGKLKIPPKTVCVTFDDGYWNNYTYAFEVLKKHGIPATIFVIVDEIGRPRGDRLSWEQLKIMRASGLVAIGSHALGPEPLVNFKSEAQLRRQIFDSKKILEEKLGAPVDSFSYPEGMFTPQIRQLVIDAGYTLAVATKPGKNYPNDDVFALKRLKVSEKCRNMFSFWMYTSGYYTWVKEVFARPRK